MIVMYLTLSVLGTNLARMFLFSIFFRMALVSGRMALSRVIFRSQYYSPVNRYKCKLTNDQPPSASTVGRPSIDSTSGLPKPRQSLSESTFGNLFKLVSPSVNSTNGHPPPPPPSSSGVWWKLLGN